MGAWPGAPVPADDTSATVAWPAQTIRHTARAPRSSSGPDVAFEDELLLLPGGTDLSPIDRLFVNGRFLNEVGLEAYERDLIELFRKPENRAMRDRIAERVLIQLTPSLSTK